MSHERLHRAVVLVLFLPAIQLGPVCLHAQTFEKLATSVRPFVDRQELAGAVMLVADKDQMLVAEAVGWADIAAQKPLGTDSMFWIASQSKSITAAALMMLMDEGKVNVDDPVEKYLPEFQGQMVVVEKDADHVLLRRPSHPITVKNVLSHTSGPPELKNSYGFGFAVGPTSFGHGGAYSTNTTADTQRGLILVWLVQHAGFPGEGKKSQEAFKLAAFEAFAPAQK